MKLLVITQAIDREDAVLGFFHRWVEVLASRFEAVQVICLRAGAYDLPANVRVSSLGKESGGNRTQYLWRLARYLVGQHWRYDAVFVHMNQEYILLAGWWWRLWGRRILLWRNHPAGNWLTRLAVWQSNRVLCTSPYSYTAKFKKTKLMPVGIDTTLFSPDTTTKRQPQSILFVARMSPIKRPDLLLTTLHQLAHEGVDFVANFYGAPLPVDQAYYDSLVRQAEQGPLVGRVRFHAAVPNHATPSIYRTHQIFVNLSPNGMYDKAIFEAAACGALPLTSNLHLRTEWGEGLFFTEGDGAHLAQQLRTLLQLPIAAQEHLRQLVSAEVAAKHSLAHLVSELVEECRPSPSRWRQIGKFGSVGLTASGLNVAAFAFLTHVMGVHYLSASIIAFLSGMVVSFGLQKFWTFRSSSLKLVHLQALVFTLTAIGGLGLNAVLVSVLIGQAHWPGVLAQITSVIIIAALNFVIYQNVIFRSRRT